MAVSPEYRAFVEELLAPLGGVEICRMFGGLGAFYQGLMFALISREQLFLKVDDGNRADFEAADSVPFSYRRGGREQAIRSYWRIPDEVLDDPEEMRGWARRAMQAAMRIDAAKPRRRSRPG